MEFRKCRSDVNGDVMERLLVYPSRSDVPNWGYCDIFSASDVHPAEVNYVAPGGD